MGFPEKDNNNSNNNNDNMSSLGGAYTFSIEPDVNDDMKLTQNHSNNNDNNNNNQPQNCLVEAIEGEEERMSLTSPLSFESPTRTNLNKCRAKLLCEEPIHPSSYKFREKLFSDLEDEEEPAPSSTSISSIGSKNRNKKEIEMNNNDEK